MSRSDGLEYPAMLKVADGILQTVVRFFEEVGCPLSDEQRAAMTEARATIARQAEQVVA